MSLGCRPVPPLGGYARSLRETLLAHPHLLPLVAARPAVTPDTLRTVEQGVQLLARAGFPLGPALDALNALTVFVTGHTTSEVAVGPDAPLPDLTGLLRPGGIPAGFPLVVGISPPRAGGVTPSIRFRTVHRVSA